MTTLLWLLDVAQISKREYMHRQEQWLVADGREYAAAHAIAEHVVREEVDIADP